MDRQKPYVRMIHPRSGTLHSRHAPSCDVDGCSQVVITPLLPDDPKPGEAMIWGVNKRPVMVASAPFIGRHDEPCVAVNEGGIIHVASLKTLIRPPVLKTFALTVPDGATQLVLPRHVRLKVEAESKDLALAKLAAMLEEVPSQGYPPDEAPW
ncbi:MAG: hypothetical protein AB7T31_18310 [Gemmatimonadales bacterium]